MKVAMVAPAEGRARLGAALDRDMALDVSAADILAKTLGGPPPVGARTVKALVQGGAAARARLAALLDWVRALDPEDAADATQPVASLRFLPPIPDPGKFLCVGKNYAEHLDELRRTELIRETPDEPTGFIKLNEVISGDGDRVARPDGITTFDYEPELAFVIGKDAHGVSREDALDHVFGVTLFNDLTAREIQKREVRSGTRFWTAKNMPGFAPIGPWVVTLDEIGDMRALEIACSVNGEERMRYRTERMIFGPPEIIEHFSRYVPLHAGDLMATGSAAGVAVGQPNAEELFLKPGDAVTVALGDVMTLTTHIVAPGEA